MIKFFRKIRQNLLSENKFSKYLIYAIGEIILVVIGILIALSINNWNNENQEKNKLVDSYKSIVDEIEFVSPIVEYQYARNDSTIVYIQKSLNLLDNNNYDSINELNFNLKGLTRLARLKYDFPVALGFIEKTNPEIIKNKKLLKLLQDFKSQLTFLDVYQTYMVDSFHNLISPYTMKNLKFSEKNNTVELTQKEHLIDNLELTNLLNLKLETDKGSSNRLTKLINTMVELKSEIKNELNKK
ncbi:hypothetical protein GGR42_002525 [Saonia flava]|uniref:Uncharacterized protein n=1 Tax=Saonia flava TaxID=523696 RepID=A0A846R3V5_9FLAO|nr:hypothetical protein [Saonia flava]NJB72034.1 hypothetical protein [Saonia flava]